LIAYERICVDLIRGNPTLFLRRDEVDSAWAFIDPIREAWEKYAVPVKAYTAGSWGPAAANSLISRDGFKWYED